MTTAVGLYMEESEISEELAKQVVQQCSRYDYQELVLLRNSKCKFDLIVLLP